MEHVRRGVPHGLILTPIWFFLYVNDLNNASDLLDQITFADDVDIFHTNRDIHSLFSDVKKELTNVKWMVFCHQSFSESQESALFNINLVWMATFLLDCQIKISKIIKLNEKNSWKFLEFYKMKAQRGNFKYVENSMLKVGCNDSQKFLVKKLS